MGLVIRKDFGVRGAFEKGLLPDEAITRSQIQPGTNISLDYPANGDIIINASGGISNIVVNQYGEVIITPRMMSGEIICDQWTDDGFFRTAGERHCGVYEATHGVAGERRYFGTALYNDIVHNWGLTNMDAWLITLWDTRTGAINPYSIQGIPKIVAIDSNTIRVWVTDPDINDPTDWRANSNTIVGLQPLCGHTRVTPKFRFTLQEYL